MSNIIKFKGIETCPISMQDHLRAKSIELDSKSAIKIGDQEYERYLLADVFYSKALNKLIDSTLPEDHVSLQRANILKDQGFNTLRWGLIYVDGKSWDVDKMLDKIETAGLLIDISLEITAEILKRGPIRNFTFKQDQDLMTTHGGALAHKARLDTAVSILDWYSGKDNKYSKSALEKDYLRNNYYIAEKYLKNGNDLYELTSNRIRWARQELISGKRMESRKLLFKAIGGVAIMDKYESNKIGRSIITLGNSIFTLTKNQALNSVVTIP